MTTNISLFNFQDQLIRTVSIENEPWFVAQDVCRILEINNVSKALERVSEEDKGVITLSDTIGNDQNFLIIDESGLYDLILGSRKLVAKPFRKWVTKDVLPSIRKTGSYQLESLEKQFESKASLKEIGEATKLFDEYFGRSYSQRYLQQQTKKHFPHLAGHEPEKEEKASLPAKALFTPTQIAQQLGLLYSTGNPSPQKANQLLERAGLQTKVGGQWNPTQKAISLNLCDRKPVDTNSRTQRDQLLWTEDVIPLIQEFVAS